MHFEFFVYVLNLLILVLKLAGLYLHEIRNIDLLGASGVFDVLCAVDQIFAG